MRYSLYRFFAGLLGSLSSDTLRRIARVMAFIFWYCVPLRRKEAIAAIQKHLHKTPEEATRIARQSFIENFQSFLEISHVAKFFADKSISRIYSPETLAMLQAETAPIVVATAHLGSWELMPGLANDLLPDRNRMVIVRSQKDPALNRLMAELRGARDMQVVDHRKATNIVLPQLRDTGVAAFLVDHNCSRKEAVFLPFLDDTAAVNIGPATLALRTKASVYPVFLLRDGKGKHLLYILSPLRTNELTGSIADRMKEIARFFTDAVATVVKKHPEQWFWMHKRWKTREKVEK